MLYRAIGVMSGSSLDGLDIVFAEFNEQAGKWQFAITHSACYPFSAEWKSKLENATQLRARDYVQLDIDFGHYLGKELNRFIAENKIQFQVGLVSSHGHTVFHHPAGKMTAQIGDGASIAAETGLPVVSNLRSMDMAFGGQGAPIVPVGEKWLMGEYDYFLNIGGICNISRNSDPFIAFDICPANRVLNLLAREAGKEYDAGGAMAASGTVNADLLEKLNSLEYYKEPFPKSLANEFGTDVVYPLIKQAGLSTPDALRTCTEHIAQQLGKTVAGLGAGGKMLVTGGGAFNYFLIERMKVAVKGNNTGLVVPEKALVNYKEALIMAFIGVLRWREEYNVLSSVTGAARSSIGGALWLGNEA